MKKKLTVLGIETLEQGVYWDSITAGLHLEVGVKRKTWRYKYRQGGKQLRPKIGHFPAMGLADARKAVEAIDNRLDVGAPVVIRKEEVAHPRSRSVMTLGQAIDKYETHRRVGGGKRIKSLDEALNTMRKNLAPHLNLPVKELTKADVRDVRNAIQERGSPVMANRFLSYTSRFMKWAVSEDYIDSNYCRDLEKTSEQKRTVFLTEAEIRKVWMACRQMELSDHRASRSFSRLIRFLIAVPSRKMEAGLLTYGAIDDDGYWHVTEHKTAELTDIDHKLLLTPTAKDALGYSSRDTGNCSPDQLCFPGRIEGKPLSGFSKLMDELRTKAGLKKHFTIHDLRRTGASHMQKMGIAKEIVDMVLNHAVGGVSGTYMVDQMTEWKAEALAHWEKQLTRILTNDGSPALRVVTSRLAALPPVVAA